jgi:hypothetical protein
LNDIIVCLWETTTQKTGTIRQREGRLPQKWHQEKTNRKHVKITARFNDGPNDPLWRKHFHDILRPQASTDLHECSDDLSLKRIISEPEPITMSHLQSSECQLISRENFNDFRLKLSQSLILRQSTKYTVSS